MFPRTPESRILRSHASTRSHLNSLCRLSSKAHISSETLPFLVGTATASPPRSFPTAQYHTPPQHIRGRCRREMHTLGLRDAPCEVHFHSLGDFGFEGQILLWAAGNGRNWGFSSVLLPVLECIMVRCEGKAGSDIQKVFIRQSSQLLCASKYVQVLGTLRYTSETEFS